MHLNGHQVACYACEDRGTERVIATQLAEALPIKDMDIARSFGMHPVSLSRFKAQAREAGAAALMPKRLGPKGPVLHQFDYFLLRGPFGPGLRGFGAAASTSPTIHSAS